MLLRVEELNRRLGELRAREQQLAEYEQLYSEADELTIGNGPLVIFDAVEVKLTGVTQVKAVLSAMLRSLEIKEALLAAQLARIERRPTARPEADGNGVAGDQSDAVEP
jgi:hypothetical protein